MLLLALKVLAISLNWSSAACRSSTIYGFFFLFDLEPANGWRRVRVGARFDFEVAFAREELWFSLQSRKPSACVLTKENLAQF